MTATTEKLAAALTAAGLTEMAKKAREGFYDDFLSPLDTPILTLVHDLRVENTLAALKLAQRAMDGDFDASKEEAEEWAKRDGKETIDELIRRS